MTAPKPKKPRKPKPVDRLAGGKTRDVAVPHTMGTALGPPTVHELADGTVWRVLEGCVYTPVGIVSVHTRTCPPPVGNCTHLVFCHKGRMHDWMSGVGMTRDTLVLAAGQFARECTKKKRKPKETK